MIRPWAYLDPKERETFRALTAFLNNRLAEQGTIDWALKLKPWQRIERIAIEELLIGPGARNLTEPWVSAWRLVEESWSSPQIEESNATAIYGIQKRLRSGDRSGALVSAIVDLVAPRLKVEQLSEWRKSYVKNPRKPKSVANILSAGLTSGELVDLSVLELAKLNEIPFLESLANALEAAVNHGLDVARRLGWHDARSSARLGFLNRVYYTHPRMRDDEAREPDAYHRGIAPSVKLLHAVIARLAEIQPIATQAFVRRWSADGSSIFLRLWAAMARSRELVSSEVVTAFLTSLDDHQFWNLHAFPEFTELRALRYRDMDANAQKNIVERLRNGPPRDHWPKKIDPAEVKNARLFWSLRELRRIEICGGVLPVRVKTWLDDQLTHFAELEEMAIDYGFLEGFTVTRHEAQPSTKFDILTGIERLKALEVDLGTGRRGWDEDPAARANDWINYPGNADKVLADLETTRNGGDDFPKVWSRFGWTHRPHQQNGQTAQYAKVDREAERVLDLLSQLSETTLLHAIRGICAWLDTWENHAVKFQGTLQIWLRLWPIAVEVTNRIPESTDDEDLIVTLPVEGDEREQMDLDTLNTPAGKLVGVFLAACPSLSLKAKAFRTGSMERQMRDIIVATGGRSGLIAKHRMIEALPYFLGADAEWAHEHLIAPLLEDSGAALLLWQAVARRTHFTEVLQIIGSAMAERANDRRLGRDTRRRLVFSLVVESLHAFREGRSPAVPNSRIQQMLRTLDDEVRASAANVIQQFVRELSRNAKSNVPEEGAERDGPDSAATLYRTAAAPFLRDVWPQERSLATPGVSSGLADLPATAGEAFAEAVDTIARFLVPFECWSMLNYGLYGDEGEAKKLTIINEEAKARALLKLLDLTVGTSEGAVVPYDLTDALDQIRAVAPSLANDLAFRRLATAARR